MPQVAVKEERSVRKVRKRRLNGKIQHSNRHPPCGAEVPQVGTKEEGTAPSVRRPTIERRDAVPHSVRAPCGAEVPQVAVKEEGARLACGARRLNGKMRYLSPAGVF